MLFPMMIDLPLADDNGPAFLEAADPQRHRRQCSPPSPAGTAPGEPVVRQAFLLTFLHLGVLPFFGALPFIIGAPDVSLIDAYFEAASGITTTGASVFVGLDELPPGSTLWRGMLNWLGGLGIAFIAMIFLPVMRVGGMQFFRTEGFDTLRQGAASRDRHRARAPHRLCRADGACMAVYQLLGMPPFEAVVHGLATIATGGFSPGDASFSDYSGADPLCRPRSSCCSAACPISATCSSSAAASGPLWRDAQVRAYLSWVCARGCWR